MRTVMRQLTKYLVLLTTLVYGAYAVSQDTKTDIATERLKPIRALLTPLVESTLFQPDCRTHRKDHCTQR